MLVVFVKTDKAFLVSPNITKDELQTYVPTYENYYEL